MDKSKVHVFWSTHVRSRPSKR